MISCRAARRHMLDVTRHTASDAVRLEVESHLEGCRACETERARWRLVTMVKEQVPPRLGHGAERRILDEMVEESRRSALSVDEPLRRPVRWLPATLSVATLIVAALLVARIGPFGAPAVTEGEVVDATAPGSVSFGGAEVRYQTGTYMTLHPGGRTLAMASGEVDVDVTPGLPGHFRVEAPRFVVEVLGTRFRVTPDGVHTLRGRVRILDRREHQLAVLVAGDTWSAPAVPAAPAAPAAETATRDDAAPAEAPRVHGAGGGAGATPRHASVSVAELLGRSRAALARGDARQARSLAQRALGAGPTEGELASTELLLADTLLVLRRRDEAIDAYRRVVRRSPRSPEAEMAAFAVGQLLFERGASADAAAAFHDYLARYPAGRFVREAREHLTNIHRVRATR